MSKQGVARCGFLAGAALGAGVAAGARLLPEAAAQTHLPPAATKVPVSAYTHSNGEGHRAFLNDADAETVRRWPI